MSEPVIAGLVEWFINAIMDAVPWPHATFTVTIVMLNGTGKTAEIRDASVEARQGDWTGKIDQDGRLRLKRRHCKKEVHFHHRDGTYLGFTTFDWKGREVFDLADLKRDIHPLESQSTIPANLN